MARHSRMTDWRVRVTAVAPTFAGLEADALVKGEQAFSPITYEGNGVRRTKEGQRIGAERVSDVTQVDLSNYPDATALWTADFYVGIIEEWTT